MQLPHLNEFLTFFVVIDPIGTIPVFIAATSGFSAADQRHIAFQAVCIAAAILLFFVLAGQIVIEALGVDLTSFELAGGLILFLFALTMIFGEGKPAEELKEITASVKRQVAIYPIASPSIASPGAMLAAITFTSNQNHSVMEQVVITGTLFSVLLLTLALLLLASPLNKLIGLSGATVISRIMGVILAAFAVDTIINALRKLPATF